MIKIDACQRWWVLSAETATTSCMSIVHPLWASSRQHEMCRRSIWSGVATNLLSVVTVCVASWMHGTYAICPLVGRKGQWKWSQLPRTAKQVRCARKALASYLLGLNGLYTESVVDRIQCTVRSVPRSLVPCVPPPRYTRIIEQQLLVLLSVVCI